MNRENLLREANKAANTCLESLRALACVNKNDRFSTVLLEQEKVYSEFAVKVRRAASEEGVKLEDEGFLPKMMLWGMTKMKSMTDHSPSKLAEILTQGINMGVISLDKIINEMEEGEDSSLVDELKNRYKETIEIVKPYL